MQRLMPYLMPLMFSTLAQSSILPDNDLMIPVSRKNDGLTEVQYNAVIDKVEAIYRPIIEDMGAKLTINRLWENPIVNAGTSKKGNEWIINLYGGYPRHALATEDGYALVICHELGHHLGGAPKKVIEGQSPGWPSVEGQADYFATLKCLRKVFRKDDNVTVMADVTVPQLVQDKCATSFSSDWEIAICKRTTVAGMSVSAISASVTLSELPTIETPDPNVVEQTKEGHPAAQCRLDTYFNGSVCEVSSARSVSIEDVTRGTCNLKTGHTEGIRPLCWFKPDK